MVRNVKIAPSPKWLRQRLRANGVRPINNIVDITNYVMLEYGQPMHAFDYRYVDGGKIIVRRSERGRDPDHARRQRPQPARPACSSSPTRRSPSALPASWAARTARSWTIPSTCVFESANFDGTSIRQTALALGMRTEASGKFEKDIDPMLTAPGRATAPASWWSCWAPARCVDGVIDVLNYVPEPVTLPLEPDKINAPAGHRHLRGRHGRISAPRWRFPSWTA